MCNGIYEPPASVKQTEFIDDILHKTLELDGKVLSYKIASRHQQWMGPDLSNKLSLLESNLASCAAPYAPYAYRRRGSEPSSRTDPFLCTTDTGTCTPPSDCAHSRKVRYCSLSKPPSTSFCFFSTRLPAWRTR
jgi:hypothetical protein